MNRTELILDKTFEDLDFMIKELKNINPHRVLHIICLSDDPASASYVRNKVVTGQKYNIKVIVHRPRNKSELIELLISLSKDTNNRIIIQSPFDTYKWGSMNELMQHIPKYMDVDGFEFSMLDLINIKTFDDMILHPNFSPTAKGVLLMMKNVMIERGLDGKNFNSQEVTVIGKGLTSGLPIAMMCEQLGATVGWCNSKTKTDVRDYYITGSNFVISCAGVESLVNKSNASKMEDVSYINVGMSRGEDGKLKADINYELSECDNTMLCNKLFGTTGKLTCTCLLMNVLL